MAQKPVRRVKSEQKPVQDEATKQPVENEVEETTEEVIEEQPAEKAAEEEVIEVETETMVKVKKLHGGALYFPKKILKPGEVAWVKKSDIPAAFMDSILILEEKSSKTVPVKKKMYDVQEQEDGTFWVLNIATGKAISKDLEAEEASTIAASLNR